MCPVPLPEKDFLGAEWQPVASVQLGVGVAKGIESACRPRGYRGLLAALASVSRSGGRGCQVSRKRSIAEVQLPCAGVR